MSANHRNDEADDRNAQPPERFFELLASGDSQAVVVLVEWTGTRAPLRGYGKDVRQQVVIGLLQTASRPGWLATFQAVKNWAAYLKAVARYEVARGKRRDARVSAAVRDLGARGVGTALDAPSLLMARESLARAIVESNELSPRQRQALHRFVLRHIGVDASTPRESDPAESHRQAVALERAKRKLKELSTLRANASKP